MPASQLRVTVSGSFRRHLSAIQDAVQALTDEGAIVLSPSDPRIVDAFGDFVFVSSDRRRSIKGIQARHLDAIAHSEFLWLVCPDGYVGQSAAMEVGFAVAAGTRIFADVAPSDWTIRQFVTPVGHVRVACALARGLDPSPRDELSLLLDPEATLDEVHRELQSVAHSLSSTGPSAEDPIDASLVRVRTMLRVPGDQ
jgi:hypothetical protein